MSATGLEALEHSIKLTHEWINELDQQLGWNNKRRAFRLLRVTLQILRDAMSPAEIADFAAQLPTLLRGSFYEHWRPGAAKDLSTLTAFLAPVYDVFRDDPLEDAEGSIMTCLDLVARRISTGEVAQVFRSLPPQIRALWPS